MTRPRQAFALLATFLLVATYSSGCDPKLVASDGGDGGGTGGGDDNPPEGVVTSAQAIGAVVGLYADLIRAALSQSGAYAGGGAARTIFTEDCITIETIPNSDPIFDVRIDGCIDANGTAYRGGVGLAPIDGFDGYYMWPYGNAEDKIIATNEANSDLNHTYDQGNLQLIFSRNGSEVSSVEVKNFVRHVLKTKTATFSCDGVIYNGGVGSHQDFPREGGVIHVAWDTVGVFDVEFAGGPTATFSLQGWNWKINLNDGTVSRVT